MNSSYTSWTKKTLLFRIHIWTTCLIYVPKKILHPLLNHIEPKKILSFWIYIWTARTSYEPKKILRSHIPLGTYIWTARVSYIPKKILHSLLNPTEEQHVYLMNLGRPHEQLINHMNLRKLYLLNTPIFFKPYIWRLLLNVTNLHKNSSYTLLT